MAFFSPLCRGHRDTVMLLGSPTIWLILCNGPYASARLLKQDLVQEYKHGMPELKLVEQEAGLGDTRFFE